ncbi:MAG: tandem-95 repeat protein, partial [Aphanocapsa feldmannii 277cV]
MTVEAVNDIPAGAEDDNITTTEDTPVTINLVSDDTDIDGDTLSVTVKKAANNGRAVVDSDGITITYTPNDHYHGLDSFEYTISDGNETVSGTINLTISPINDVPVAGDDDITTTEDTAVTITPTVNDTDADGDTLSVTAVTEPSNGSAVLNVDDDTVTY